ncbi:MAG: undecaprenyl-diphosphate phosphatase [Bdellovibrionota bacterium]
MEPIHSLVLGILQGLTEFLPVSSSAHLVLAPFLFEWKDPGLAFDVALHMGTLGALLGYYWKDWLDLAKQPFQKKKNKNGIQWKHLIVGTIPAVIFGFTLQKHAEETFRNPLLIAFTLTAFGLLLFYFDRKGSQSRNLSGLSVRDALVIGAAQALAIIPGVSRSGVTITAALALGMSRSAATRFSFLLSAPVVGGAGLLKGKYIVQALTAGGNEAATILLGLSASFISGAFAIGLLSYIAKTKTFNVFVVYRVLLALVIVIVVISR